MNKMKVYVQCDSEGANIQTHQLHVTRKQHQRYGWHGFVTFNGREYGVYSANGTIWNLDLF